MITKYTPAEKMSLTELKTTAKKRGYIVEKLDGEIEIYPKGKRGDASYYTDDALDACKTMRLDYVVISAFRQLVCLGRQRAGM